MDLRSAIKQILLERGRTQDWLADELGYSSRSAVQNMLARGNVELNTILRICEAVGGKLFIRYGHREVEITKKEGKK